MACKIKECPVNGEWDDWSNVHQNVVMDLVAKQKTSDPIHGGQACTSVKDSN